MNIDELTIENAAPGDFEAIVEIYNSTIPGRMVTADTEKVTVKDKLYWFNEHTPDRRPLWVARLKNEVVGWLSFQSFYGRAAYSKTAEVSIYIHENHRRKGLGGLLLQRAVDRAPGLGIFNLLGFVFGHNLPSLRLFNRFGFEKWGKLPGVAELDGVERDLIIPGKKLR